MVKTFVRPYEDETDGKVKKQKTTGVSQSPRKTNSTPSGPPLCEVHGAHVTSEHSTRDIFWTKRETRTDRNNLPPWQSTTLVPKLSLQ